MSRLTTVDQTRVFSNFGPQETQLRERFARLLGVDVERVATASNATIGLMGAVAITGETQWVVPSFTFPASPAAVLTTGGAVEFGDIDSDWSLRSVDVYRDGVMPVAPFGAAVKFSRWQDKNTVVFDAAASLGAPPPLWAEMREGWSVVYSLHATKILGSGEGSVIVFGSKEAADEFHAWTNFGFSGTRNSVLVGINGKMSEIQAAYAHAALDGWDDEQEDWHAARALANQVEEDLGIAGLPWSSEGVNPYWIVSLDSENTTRAVESALKDAGIESRRWWGYGCHTMPAFAEVPCRDLVMTENVASRSLGLPMFRDIEPVAMNRIADVLSAVLQ
jgi:dTDP-4-amino-4,6-dideoxygalactose transaminase